MRDTFNSENIGDFQQRYVDTYGWLYRDDGQRVFVYVKSHDDDAVYFTAGRGPQFSVNIDSGMEFEFIPVDRGWYRSQDGSLYYMQRRPARQWRRGIASSNTEIFNKDGGGVELSYQLLNNIFSCDQSPINYGDGTALISKHFALVSGAVKFYHEGIGYGIGDTLYLNSPLVQHELAAAIKRANLPFKVTVNV